MLQRCFTLAEAVYGFFANGGTSCYVVGFLTPDRTGDRGGARRRRRKRTGLGGLETVPEVTMVAVPGLWDMTVAATEGSAPPQPDQLTVDEQAGLNDKGVNCLRDFPDRGVLVWGARTGSGGSDWRYLNVRRLVSFLADSLHRSTTWAVFEPHDERRWATLRHSATSFLTDQWRQGALMGRTPDEAFYVLCDHTNNTRTTIDAGQVVCDIGVAPVRPAEFVRFTVTQLAGQTGGND